MKPSPEPSLVVYLAQFQSIPLTGILFLNVIIAVSTSNIMQPKIVIGLSLSRELVSELDTRRGLVTRSTYVENALCEWLKLESERRGCLASALSPGSTPGSERR
jgi:hypothetical protein